MNWPLEQFKGKSVVFVGVGQGRSMTGFKSFITPHGDIKDFEGVDKHEGSDPLGFLKEYNQATTIFIKNEAIPPDEMPVPYVTPMNVFFSCVKALGAQTVGITGTKGKSTTAALAAAMLQMDGRHVVLGGNIGEFGESLFEHLDDATKETIFVIELSSYQLADIEHSPHVSACINLYNDHSDWHGSKQDYWHAKKNIIAYAQADDLFIYNPTFPELQQWAETALCRTQAIDINEDIDMENTVLYGEHNRLNALVARAVAREFNVTDNASQKALDMFKPLPHRMEFILEKNGHIYIDDAIGMTPESTTASLQAVAARYGQVGCLLLGGQDRDYDFTELFKVIAQHGIPTLVLFPDTVEKMKAAIPSNYEPEIFEAKNMEEGVKWASEHAPDNSVILLSTAAPSYSLWKKGFVEKGEKFVEAAEAL